jgi:hypothetical protein
MARNRIIGPATAREVRKPSRVADAAAHAEYREMIVAEIGQPDFRAQHVDDGRPVGLLALLFRPLSLFLLSIIALASVYTFKLWREGWFEQFRQVEEVPLVAAPTTSWIAGRGQAPPIEGRVPVAKPKPVTAPAPEPSGSSADEDEDVPAEQ